MDNCAEGIIPQKKLLQINNYQKCCRVLNLLINSSTVLYLQLARREFPLGTLF
jgi:hypothetical protein